MPIYEHECGTCNHPFELLLKIAELEDPQVCPECGAEAHRVVSLVNFNLPGDGFPGKNNRISNQMREKNRRLKGKEDQAKRDGRVPSLVPNVDGERTKDWGEAKKLAESKGKSTTGYDKKIVQSKSP